MQKMIEVQIDSVRVHLMTPNRVVVLKQVNEERYLPIWVGPYEAEAITIALQEVEVSRPLTHDLLRNIFNAFNARITRIEIVKLENDTYFGAIIAELNGKELKIDSRSSDAIALSVRAHVPIYVHPSVMDAASIIPEEEVAESAAPPPKSEPAPLTKEGAERLSVFENFLEKLDFDKPDESKPEGDAPDQPKKPKKK
ncbi:MAG: bifunctional nuclease family protein [Anaerolineae bacterium]|nr:MAG: bifunctional nuclease family protein [Anaerolineae bacterium]WKZ45004.1 MAG: bifunctional nuclease family protein [Anaerolineales bacterium]